jgi:DNA topoisomerase-1
MVTPIRKCNHMNTQTCNSNLAIRQWMLWLLFVFYSSLAVAAPSKNCPALWEELTRQEKMASAAAEAGLNYIKPGEEAGISRAKRGKKFVYFNARGKEITNQKTIDRINALRLPPKYKNVWISSDPEAHIQATAIDTKGGVQYRYHPEWIKFQSGSKFSRIEEFGKSLPAIREKVQSDLAKPGTPKDKVLAAIVSLLDTSYIRIGNEEYVKKNASFGLTTFRKIHVRVRGDEIEFDFLGKSKKHHKQTVDNPEVADLLKKLRKLPGDNIFQYTDESGKVFAISSNDVNAYIKGISEGPFTAKDFRTWGGSVAAARALLEVGLGEGEKEIAARVKSAIQFAASKLENTPSVAEKNYIHPEVIAAFKRGDEEFSRRISKNEKRAQAQAEELVLDLISKK